MTFTIFQSEEGDCLLLESKGGKTILCDGGIRRSYETFVAPALGKLREAGRELDVAYVSHIDEDHIAGVLELMDNEVAWRVYEHQKANGNTSVKKPKVARPPVVKAVWHNSFYDQVEKNAGPIGDMLAASARILSASSNPEILDLAAEHAELALSKPQALRLSQRVSGKQLGIPLNAPSAGKLMMVREDKAAVVLGDLKLFVIGPFEADLKKLRTEWNNWLEKAQSTIAGLREQAERDERNLKNGVAALLGSLELAAGKFGNRTGVTTPNLASLMFYVEEKRPDGNKKLLLTGDGHYGDVLKGLRHHGLLSEGGEAGIHIDVLKGQHHGAKANWHEDFVKAVTADHYIFMGNGEHTNPELDVVQLVLDSRIGPAEKRSKNPEVGKPFTLWFNSSEEATAKTDNKRHMKKLQDLLVSKREESNKVNFRFLDKASFGFSV